MQALTLLPFQDYVLIKPYAPPEESKGGIIIPEAYRTARPITTGTIMEIGPNVVNCQIGQIVLFPQHSEYRVQMGNETVFYVREPDIIAGSVIESEKRELEIQYQCPACNEVVKRQTKTCPHCGLGHL